MTDDRNVTVSGLQRLEDVEGKTFTASGSATVSGDVDVETVEASGSLEVQGSVDATRFDASGSTEIQGDLNADRATVSGSLRVTGSTALGEMESSGSTALADVSGGHLSSSGSLTADTVEVDTVTASGVVTAESLRANQVSLEAKGASEIGTIEAEEIRVERASGLFGLDVLSGSAGTLVAERIVGESVALVGVEADRVAGTGVRIGADCHVGTVEADRLEVHESATVEEERER
jgi:cytoskeletal protein CcmA (bactofilin family)